MPVTHSHKRSSFFPVTSEMVNFSRMVMLSRHMIKRNFFSEESELSAEQKRFQKCFVVLELHSKYCGNALTRLSEALKKSCFYNFDKNRSDLLMPSNIFVFVRHKTATEI